MVTQLADGRTLFKVFLPHAAKVEVVGTFTGWRAGALAMERQNPGWWSLVTNVEGGAHEFCYLVDGSIWLADYAANGVRLASSGHWVSRLNVAVEASSAGGVSSGPAAAPRALAV
jgi:1,4-alpha-glucan branching enzyme